MRALVLHMSMLAVLGSRASEPLVATKLGLIRGLHATDGDYTMYLGVPYARVNRSNPFGASLPYPKFESVFEAYDDSAMCPQKEEFEKTIAGTLDCLHINIYVPKHANYSNRVPVLVWIYGGEFQYGFASRYAYGPKYLVRHGIILITFNYRVGPYGFMCLDMPDVPGNQGLKDQLSALRWIKNNIDAFGGDEDKITLFGISAGAASVDFHLLSKQEKLFDKVIVESGSSLNFWSLWEPNSDALYEIARYFGLVTGDDSSILAFLSTVEPTLIITAVTELSLKFNPCVERDFVGVERFITDYPINTAIPKARDTAILSGYTNDEMLLTYTKDKGKVETYKNVFKKYLRTTFDLSGNEEMEAIMRQFYIGDEEPSEKLKGSVIDFMADIFYNYPMHRSLQKYLNNGAKFVYHYIFSHSGGRNFIKRRNNITIGGASHADEVGYLFDVSFFDDVPSAVDQLLIDRMTTMWSNFAKYGNPTPTTSTLLPVKWRPATKDAMTYLNIEKDMELKRRPFYSRMAFWDLFYRMYKKLQRGYRDNA